MAVISRANPTSPIVITCYRGKEVVVTSDRMRAIIERSSVLTQLLPKIESELSQTGISKWKVTFHDCTQSDIGCVDETTNTIIVRALSQHQQFEFLTIERNCPTQVADYNFDRVVKVVENFTQSIEVILSQEKRVVKAPYALNLFKSEVYRSFISRMNRFIEEYKYKYPNAVQYLEPFFEYLSSVENKQTPGAFHREFLTRLRGLIAEKKVPNEQWTERRKFLVEFTTWMFTQYDLIEGRWGHLSSLQLSEILFQSNPDQFKTLKEFYFEQYIKRQFTGTSPQEFTDRLRDGCLPYECAKLKFGNTTTSILHTPQLTYKKNYQGSKIVGYNILPEARVFFEGVSEKGKRLLYINLMETLSVTRKHSVETDHSEHLEKIIHSLDRSVKFMSLDFYSERAKQTGKFAESNDQLEVVLTGAVLSSFSGCLEDVNIHDSIKNVHQHFFKSSKKLDANQRKELLTLLMVDVLTSYLEKQPYDYVAIACENGCVISPFLLALIYVYQTVKQNKILNDRDYIKVYTILFSNPLLVGNKLPPIHYLSLFEACAERIKELGVPASI